MSSSPVVLQAAHTVPPLLKQRSCDRTLLCLGTQMAHQHDLDETHPTQNKIQSPLQLVLMFD